MFATLKNKIKEETGNEVPVLPTRLQQNNNRYQRSHSGPFMESTSSCGSVENLSLHEQRDAEIQALRIQCNDLTIKLQDITQKHQNLDETSRQLEQTNKLLEESVKVAQVQKDLYYDEQDKIQNLQSQEIAKLKSLLNFREQEAVDRLAAIRQYQQQLEQLKTENRQLRQLEEQREEIEDELEKLRHSSQIDINNLKTTLAVTDEQNRHLITKLKVLEEARFNFTIDMGDNERIQALIHERKFLEQRLEEAHIQLSDIKSSWSAQNLALETQVSRLSRQVAAETTEKRKALTAQDENLEKTKELEFELEKLHIEITQRDNKIKILSEEIDDLSSTLKEIRTDDEEEIQFLRTKINQSEQEVEDLKSRLTAADDRLSEHIDQSDVLVKSLQNQLDDIRNDYNGMCKLLEDERSEKATCLLKNAEISQELAIIKQQLKSETIENTELQESLQKLQADLEIREQELSASAVKHMELNQVISIQTSQIEQIDELNKELVDRNKTIKILKQRLVDVKKTLQHELKGGGGGNNQYHSNQNFSNGFHEINSSKIDNMMSNNEMDSIISTDSMGKNITSAKNNYNNKTDAPSGGGGVCLDRPPKSIVMDEVNFKYLKHVILKFLTSREVEARHLIRAVGTLLQLTKDEEKLLHDTLSFKMSWFGSRPESISKLNNFI